MKIDTWKIIDGTWRAMNMDANNGRIYRGETEQEAITSCEAAEQSVHWTLLESAPLEALSTPEHLATSQSDSAPTTAQVA